MRYTTQRLSIVGLTIAVSFTGFYLLFALAATASPGPKVAAHSLAVHNACDPITTNTTWASGVYTATDCDITVPAGVTLTLQAGAVVKVSGGGSALIVNGGLVAQGTASQPVVFTSLADDAHGGDTDHNGASSGAAGDWYGIVFRSGSVGRLDGFFAGYAGSGAFNSTMSSYDRAQIDVQGADVHLRNGTVTTGLRKGVYLEGAGITPVIENMTITGNKSNDPSDWSTLGYPVWQETINQQPTYSNLTFSSNDVDVVMLSVYDSITQSVTLSGTVFSIPGELRVTSGVTVTIGPGTQFSFLPATYGNYGSHSTSVISVNGGGALLAEGTPTQPITFTSILTTPAPGNWGGIVAQEGARVRLAYCDVSYAGDATQYYDEGLEIRTTDAQVSNCHIHHNANDGIYISPPSGGSLHTSFTNVDVTDNGNYGVYLDTSHSSLSVTWDGGSISRNGWSGIFGHTYFSAINPTFRNLTISDNGGAGDSDDRKKGIAFDYGGISPVFENLTLTNNVSAAISWYCAGNITARNITATGNGADVLNLPGCSIGGGVQWDLGDTGIPVSVTYDIEVASGGFLSIMPGTTLAFDKYVPLNGKTSLTVDSNAALYALGTAGKPVVFTGAAQTPGAWGGILVYYYDNTALFLRNCEIAYGGEGGYAFANLRINGWDTAGAPDTAVIQNCDIHHSSRQGVYFNGVVTPVVLQNNSIHDNAQEGAVAWGGSTTRDARYNWWGDASGPYNATSNPTGQGEEVGDNILFDPWLTAPPTQTESINQMIVRTGAPTQVSPGQMADYAIQYLNLMTTTVKNGLVMVQLPRAAEYVDNNSGGIYWPERDQVFWKLGDLAPGAQGMLSFRVRFQWGLPQDYQDSSITIFTADNYNAGEIDRQAYLDYQPGGVDGVVLLSNSQFQAQLAASPTLKSAYDAAIAAGYSFHSAANVTRSEGETVLEVALYKADLRTARILALQGGHVLITTIDAGEVAIEDSSGGGMALDLSTGDKRVWGDWAGHVQTAGALPATPDQATAGCTSDACTRNCRWSIVGWEYIKKKAGRIIAWTALAPFTGGASLAGDVWEVGSIIKKVYDCDLDCRADPSAYCCTAGQKRWSGGGLLGRATNSCYFENCNAAVGLWTPGGYKTCIAYGQRCVPGIRSDGCVDCNEHNAQMSYDEQNLTVSTADAAAAEDVVGGCRAAGAGGKPRCRDLKKLWVHDPNALYGPEGDLLPSQLVTYTITYENEGVGRAYGVYVMDTLPDALDETTLNLHGSGVYQPESREIFWLVSELGPKGDPDSKGTITYTVRVKSGLPSGSVVDNQATVYFPSVPEETPTAPWINLVAPLVAEPQHVQTSYQMPLSITLHGRDVSGLPLTYEIVASPHGGTLSGTLPALVYTPLGNFSGSDSFSFRVTNGVTESRSAQIYIDVTTAGDTTPPQVLWANPANGATDVSISATPLYTDTAGSLFSPVLAVGMSEAISETTVTTATVYLQSSGGITVPARVDFDPNLNQVILQPRSALQSGMTYTLTLTSGLKDLAGNPLATTYQTWFTTAVTQKFIYLPITLR